MAVTNPFCRAVVLSATLFSTAIITSCASHAGYHIYDPYYADYHAWGPGEAVYYDRWVTGNHLPLQDFRKLNSEQQRQYWTWRHSQPPAQRPSERP